MDLRRVVTPHQDRLVAVAGEQRQQLFVRDPRQYRRVGDLVAVQVQDRQDRPVVYRVEEFIGVPARGQRTGLGLAITDDAGDQQARVVERGAVGVRQRVTELTALMDRPGGLRRHMAWDAAGEGELPEQPAQPLGIPGDLRVDLAVGAFEVGIRDQARSAVARPDHIHRGQPSADNDPVQVGVEQVQPRRVPPVAEQSRLDVRQRQRLSQ